MFRPSTGVWYIFRSADRGATITSWGLNGDIPVPGDYDGDGKADIGVFRPSSGVWYVVRSSNSTNLITQFGLNGDLPIPFYERP